MSNWSRDLLGIDSISEISGSVAISSNLLSINLSAGATVFYVTLNSNVNTLSVTDVPTSVASFTLVLIADGTARTVIWGGSVKWPAGTAPTLTSTAGKVDILSFITLNGGTDWYGFVGGQNF